jgi:hypothetical protein
VFKEQNEPSCHSGSRVEALRGATLRHIRKRAGAERTHGDSSTA